MVFTCRSYSLMVVVCVDFQKSGIHAFAAFSRCLAKEFYTFCMRNNSHVKGNVQDQCQFSVSDM